MNDKVLGLRRNHTLLISHLWPLYSKVSDIVNNFIDTFSTKRPSSNNKLIRNNSKRPPVNTIIIPRNSVYYLRCNIVRSSDKQLSSTSDDAYSTSSFLSSIFCTLLHLSRLFYHFFHLNLWQSKISQFYMTIFINYYILGF